MTILNPSVLFVYGTLRKGQRNHHFLDTAKFLGDATVTGQLYMMWSNGLPLAVKTYYENKDRYWGKTAVPVPDTSRVVGEVYEIPANLWDRLDRLESHPNWYIRELVDAQMEDGSVTKVWVYFMPLEIVHYNNTRHIPSGDFVEGYKQFIADYEKVNEGNRKKKAG